MIGKKKYFGLNDRFSMYFEFDKSYLFLNVFKTSIFFTKFNMFFVEWFQTKDDKIMAKSKISFLHSMISPQDQV